jgi:hypothetical protein
MALPSGAPAELMSLFPVVAAALQNLNHATQDSDADSPSKRSQCSRGRSSSKQ